LPTAISRLRSWERCSDAVTVEVLRRDHAISVLFGKPPKSWAALLRIVLGHPDRKHAGTPTGDGVLLRLLCGEPLDSLRCDSSLLAAIWAAKPDRHRNS